MRICWILTAAPLALLVACAQEAPEREMSAATPDEELAAEQEDEILSNEKKIREVEKKIGEALDMANSEKGAEEASKFYKADAFVVVPSGILRGRSAVATAFKGQFDNDGYEVTFNNDEAYFLANGNRSAITHWSAVWKYTWEGDKYIQTVHSFTFWEKDSGGDKWLIEKDFFVTEPPRKLDGRELFANPIGPGVPRPKRVPDLPSMTN